MVDAADVDELSDALTGAALLLEGAAAVPDVGFTAVAAVAEETLDAVTAVAVFVDEAMLEDMMLLASEGLMCGGTKGACWCDDECDEDRLEDTVFRKPSVDFILVPCCGCWCSEEWEDDRLADMVVVVEEPCRVLR